MWRILIAVIVAGACVLPATSPAPESTANTSGALGLAAAQPSRHPGDLPVYPEEAGVIKAIAEAGFNVDSIGVSKFEDYIFGERKRARDFGAPIEGTRDRIRVDVLFLDRPAGSVRICPGAGLYEYSISIDGRNVTVGGAQRIFFGVGDHFFVMRRTGASWMRCSRASLFRGRRVDP